MLRDLTFLVSLGFIPASVDLQSLCLPVFLRDPETPEVLLMYSRILDQRILFRKIFHLDGRNNRFL